MHNSVYTFIYLHMDHIIRLSANQKDFSTIGIE